jgi:hypothetical protein
MPRSDDPKPRLLWRHRSLLIWALPLCVLALLWHTDPDGGASTQVWLLRVLMAFVAIGLSHWVRRAYFDYPEADLRALFKKAREEPTGAGLALVAVAIFLFGVLMLFSGQVRAQDARTYVPAPARQYLPVLAAEQRRFWPDHPSPELLAALVEHESCVTLKHPRCWNPLSRLKSAREEGAGFGQITRAYRADGSLRFDALQDLRGRHAAALGDWTWQNVYSRPDLQLRAVVLMMLDNYQVIARLVREPQAALAFADAAYNGGLGGVQNERRACGLKPGCDPQRWFGHVELVCLKSKVALYGGRSACDINRHHVKDVLLVRAGKYRDLLL